MAPALEYQEKVARRGGIRVRWLQYPEGYSSNNSKYRESHHQNIKGGAAEEGTLEDSNPDGHPFAGPV
jgi:hypothetical protein